MSNAVSQGIGMATGLQRRFDWTGVAAASVVSGVNAHVGAKLGYDPNLKTQTIDNAFKGGVAGVAGAIAGAARLLAMCGNSADARA